MKNSINKQLLAGLIKLHDDNAYYAILLLSDLLKTGDKDEREESYKLLTDVCIESNHPLLNEMVVETMTNRYKNESIDMDDKYHIVLSTGKIYNNCLKNNIEIKVNVLDFLKEVSITDDYYLSEGIAIQQLGICISHLDEDTKQPYIDHIKSLDGHSITGCMFFKQRLITEALTLNDR